MIFALISRKKKCRNQHFLGNIGLLRRGVAHPLLGGGLRQGVAKLSRGGVLRQGVALFTVLKLCDFCLALMYFCLMFPLL